MLVMLRLCCILWDAEAAFKPVLASNAAEVHRPRHGSEEH